MKAAIMPEAGKIEIREVELPKMQEDEVLVKIKAVGVCTFEQKFYYGESQGFPFAGGHEICGVVERVGANVAQNLKAGDKVIILSLTRCGECYYCRKGYDNQCENAKDVQKIPGVDGPGGFAEHFIAKGYEVYKIDETVPFERGTLAEPLSCVTHSMNMSGITSGDYALVCGAGTMGILHLLLAKLRGAKVIVSEPNELRRKQALEFGADYVVDPITEDQKQRIMEVTHGHGVERAFFTAGGKAAITGALAVLAIRGVLVIYGGTKASDKIEIDPKKFHYDEITITGVIKHTKETIQTASELLSLKELPLDKLITSRFPFERIEDALKEARKMDSYRAVVLMNQEEK
ncbi:zinc-dependent alcohol dehydrogenase [Muricomes intestini]|uniref:2-desacetyl-2-hydroxyethyl bacteriochlorophyllide A dehydrogenase n=2 Tax=Muricomes intestini TaxID=1796634 RepID=A0A4R3K3X6_9FIRM|nr:2-desacetyl-2-hydroxyethyl bacteriochlorophyllide A dehydrogenase [Muricomes intestini]HAX51670.1 Zn-dependent alcohol dehydrogenase [Lachnospiraceae bacterium]